MGKRGKRRRKNLALFAGGITGDHAFKTVWDNETVKHLRKACFRLRRFFVDHRRRMKRYLRFYPDPAAPQQFTYDEALRQGYPADNLFKVDHDEKFILDQIEQAEIDAIVVVSYGAALEESIIDAVHGNCFVVHPVRPLPAGAKRIPKADRGSAIIERAVEDGTSKVPLQIAMIRAEPVVNPSDPADWDKGELLAQSAIFFGPTFDADEQGPDKLAVRVMKTQAAIATHYGEVLYQLPRVLGFTPDQLIDAGISRARVRHDFGFEPEELFEAGLLNNEWKLRKKKKKKKHKKD